MAVMIWIVWPGHAWVQSESLQLDAFPGVRSRSRRVVAQWQPRCSCRVQSWVAAAASVATVAGSVVRGRGDVPR